MIGKAHLLPLVCIAGGVAANTLGLIDALPRETDGRQDRVGFAMNALCLALAAGCFGLVMVVVATGGA